MTSAFAPAPLRGVRATSARRALFVLLAVAVPLASCGGTTTAPVTPATPVASATADAPAAPPPVFPPDWPYKQGAPTPRSARGMVVTDESLSTKVGASVLASGGNAMDAAVATFFALAVAFPSAGNIGGGGFMVARVGGKPYALDFREAAPGAATRDMYLGPDGKPTRDTREGWRASGVPGSVAGMYEAWKALGSKQKTWAELLQPAIDLADHGFAVDASFDERIGYLQKRLAKFPASAALFLPNGAPPPVGSTWRDPDLAQVLRRIAAQGPAGFYEGPVADALASGMKANGGLITKEDLGAYQAKWRTPVEFDYRGRHVIGMPPPSSGGVTMAMIAHILEGYDLRAAGWHSAREVHLVAEAMRRAFAARNAKLGDPDFVSMPLAELLSPEWAAKQRATILPDKATSTRELFPQLAAPDDPGAHTTHFSVVDGNGDAIAITTTLNGWYGSGVTVPGVGFLLNNEMDDFATVPGTANMFGLVQGEPNAIAPHKRMLSSMSPSIVLDPRGGGPGSGGQVEAVLGAAGGSRIITAVFEELSNLVDYGMDAGDAVRAPRFHQQDWPDKLFLEPRALPEDVVQALHAMGHATEETEHLADAPGVGRDRGLWEGAAEPRREGSLAVGP